MEKALEGVRIALGPSHPEVTEFVLSLAAIYRQFDRSRDAVELLQKELEFLTGEGQALSPGVSQASCSIFGTCALCARFRCCASVGWVSSGTERHMDEGVCCSSLWHGIAAHLNV